MGDIVDVVEKSVSTLSEGLPNNINEKGEHKAIHDSIAIVKGEKFDALPEDLFIPPEAMEVILDVFEGPLDLLLYLIKRHNLDILDIKVSEITKQYINYIELMDIFKLELAADYLEMAALLTEIKSRMMLPRQNENEEDEVDPRAELVRRLQEYERIKIAAENLDEIPREERDIYIAKADTPDLNLQRPHPEVDLKELLMAFQDVLKRIKLDTSHKVELEILSVRERMSFILETLEGDEFIEFIHFFDLKEGKSGVVVTFMAILELAKEALIEIVQAEPFSPIYIRAAIC